MISKTDILRAKILVVDDKEANVILLERMLRGAGYEAVTHTMLPDQVCPLHLEHRYDLILLDLEMPRMDGFQVMENLAQIEVGSYLPVLVITAQPGHKLRALKAGARDFVSKPFDLGEVLLRVHNLLEMRLLHLETKRLYERVLAEQAVSQRLLLTGLPASVGERLAAIPRRAPPSTGDTITDSFAEVTLLFADVVRFTEFAEGVSAGVLTGVLDDLAARFTGEDHAPSVDAERTLGDAYLAAIALPDARADRAITASRMALDLVQSLDRFNSASRYTIKLAIGVESTPARPRGKKRTARFVL